MAFDPAPRPTHILDDDPTGTQCVEAARVVLWPPGKGPDRVIPADSAVYHLTNTRALTPEEAGAMVGRVVGRIVASQPSARIVLRGDSTLRGHVFEEYEAAADVAYSVPPTLLLVPAMPSAGRVTANGVQLVDDGRTRRPVASTPYAADPRLGYHNSQLLEWAQERSRGRLPARRGRVVALGALRRRGPDVIAEELVSMSNLGEASVCAVDAETHGDLEVIAAGLVAAESQGANVLVRSAPPFAALLGGCFAETPRSAPRSEKALVVCGSFVPLATRQLEALSVRFPGSVVQVDLDALVARPGPEQDRLATALDRRLEVSDLAVLATPRSAPSAGLGFGESLRIAENLAAVLPLLRRLPSVIIAKGGVTSATVASVGLGADTAWVEGPAMSGVATWSVARDSRETRLLVVPGNVGSDRLLAELVSEVLGLVRDSTA